jgi:hypothetical protein
VSAMTAEQVERRDFSYCSAYYLDPDPDPRWVRGLRPRHERFLVGTPYTAEAKQRALAFATTRWGPPEEVNVYPRNYIRDARVLFAQGLHD